MKKDLKFWITYFLDHLLLVVVKEGVLLIPHCLVISFCKKRVILYTYLSIDVWQKSLNLFSAEDLLLKFAVKVTYS